MLMLALHLRTRLKTENIFSMSLSRFSLGYQRPFTNAVLLLATLLTNYSVVDIVSRLAVWALKQNGGRFFAFSKCL